MKKYLLFVMSLGVQLVFTAMAFATEEGASAQASGSSLAAIGAGLAMGLAALGGGLGQGRAASAALEGIARNPGAANKVQTPMILGLALIESLVIFSFVIAILLVFKV